MKCTYRKLDCTSVLSLIADDDEGEEDEGEEGGKSTANFMPLCITAISHGLTII